MDLMDSWKQIPRRIAEYFVICGLPNEPEFYDYSKVIAHGEELIIPDKPVDFTAYCAPIIDIQFVSLKDKAALPFGYHAIRHSRSGKYKANIKGRLGEEVYLCYRRGREKPPITNISMFAENENHCLKPGAQKITETLDGRNAKLKLVPPTYLSYTRASPSGGIDQLAVIDMCIIFPNKHETCPPAYIQLQESLTGNLLGGNAYLCFRKSLVKEHTIAYQPKILFWYRVPPIPSDCCDEPNNPSEEPASVPATGDSKVVAQLNEFSLDPDIRQVAEFCLPWGAMVESWSVEQDIPQTNSFSFVLTNQTGERLYGVAFTFHEPYNITKLDMDQCYRLGVDPEIVFPEPTTDPIITELNPEEEAKITARQKHFLRSRIGDRVVGVTKALCLLSRWSFPVAFTNFLAFLYSRCYPGVNNDPVPLERYLTHFLCEVPFPDQNTPNVLVELCAAPILLESPDDPKTTSSCEPFFYLLSLLGVDLTINLFIHMLTEQKILLTSVHHFLLSQVGEALISMIFPLQWAVVYIPFIYMGHIQVIQSPSPYLIGVDSRFFDFFRLPSGSAGVTYVDLDTRNFRPADVPGQPVLEGKLLPKKLMGILRARLTELYNQILSLNNRRRKSSTNALLRSLFSEPGSELANDQLSLLRKQADIGLNVKEAFMHCMAYLLRGYRDFVISVRKAERDQLFDSEGFLRRVGDDRSRPLFEMLFDTQHWVNFVRDRSYLSPRDEQLAEFDNLIDSLSYPSEGRSLSNSSLATNDSLSLIVDHPTNDGNSQRGSSTEELSALRLPTQGRWNSDSIRIIGPPSWPISEPFWTTSINNGVESAVRKHVACPFDLVPNQWNSSLLDRLASYSYSIQLVPGHEINVNPDSTAMLFPLRHPLPPHLNPALYGSWNSLNSSRHQNGWRFLPDYLRSAAVDSPSPSLSRSVTTTPIGLTGLPTDYPLPIKTSSILKRSVLELRCSMECGKRLHHGYDVSWAKCLIASMYSLWFMLLPSYLASLYTYALQSPQADSEAATVSLNECLTEAVKMASRLCAAEIECQDQVICRVLLVLVYQNRPPKVPLLEFLDGLYWNHSSIGLANHIYKAYEKECQDAERLRSERERQLTRFRSHRRSASACCVMPEATTTPSAETNPDEPRERHCAPCLTDVNTLVPTTCHDTSLTHKRSSSSTIAPFGALGAQPCFHLTKSETDSGLHLGVSMNEDLGPNDDRIDDSIMHAESEVNIIDSELEQSMNNVRLVQGRSAPLASLDEDLADLGYSTLHRPPSDLTTNADEINGCTIDCQQVQSPIRSTMTQAPMEKPCNSSLEPVQRPSPAAWLEKQTTEFRPAPRESAKQDTPFHLSHNNDDHPSTTESRSSDESDTESDVSQCSRKAQPTVSRHNQPRKPNSTEHGQSSESSCDSPRDDLSRPRGSFDQLATALTSLGRSELTTKVIQSVRDWLTPLSRSSTGTPNPGRRASVAERFLLSSPNSGRLPRDMKRWQMRTSEPNADWVNNHDFHQGVLWDEKETTEVIEDVSASVSTQLQQLRSLWFQIAGGLVVGIPFQRLCPATIPTQALMSSANIRSPCLPKAVNPSSSMETTLTPENTQLPNPSTGVCNPNLNVTQLYVLLTTCTLCPNCHRFLHDEEIMASWSCDEDEYHIPCAFCQHSLVPQLTVRVLGDVRSRCDEDALSRSHTIDSNRGPVRSDSTYSMPETSSPPSPSGVSKGLLEFTQYYLSPFVLRKTLENVIQREGDDCFRSFIPRQSLLYRHERLVWNLVWYIHRLGLPTHLLDHFPLWLMERQSQEQLTTGTPFSPNLRRVDGASRIPNALMNVKLSPDLPVRISLRWNAFQAARGMSNKPLYKQWLRRKAEYKSQWMLVPGKPNSSPVLSPDNLDLSTSSSCPVEATMARVVNSIRSSDMHFALDSMIQFRASVQYNKPMSTVIRPTSAESSPNSPSCIDTAQTDLVHTHNTQRPPCTDSHQCAWCLDGSLYRELLFLTLSALPPNRVNLVAFDVEYDTAYRLLRTKGNALIHASDRAPNLVASACRQMLRPLTLNH